MHNNQRHPLAEVSDSLARLEASLKEARALLGGQKPSPNDKASKMRSKAFAEQAVVECCRDLQNAPTALLEALASIIANKDYWGIAAAIMVFGDAVRKLRVHIAKAWVTKDPVVFLQNRPPSAFLDSRRSATDWSL